MSPDNLSNVLHSTNAEYIAHLYEQYLENPTQVNQSWRDFFGGLQDDEAALLAELNGASWTPEENRKSGNAFKHARPETYMMSESVTKPLSAANQGDRKSVV